MDRKITLEEVKTRVEKMRQDRGWQIEPRSTAISICLEAAELLEHFQWDKESKKLSDPKLTSAKRKEVESEVADIIVYLTEFAVYYHIDISFALQRKLNHINEKYPAAKILSDHDGKFYRHQKKKYCRRKT